MINSLISVIVPIHNDEKYLKKCIDSIINQSYKNIEVLLINDGSLDNSLSICKEYALNDFRVKYFSKENGGVSSARNYALEIAGGEWITFVDGDDYLVDDHAFEKMANNISDTYTYYCFNNNKDGEIINKALTGENKRDLIESVLCWRILEEYYNNNLLFSVCGSFYNKGIIDNNHIRFDEKLFKGENMLFNIEYICKIRNLCSIPSYIYYYRKNNKSNISLFEDDIIEADYHFHKRLIQILKDNKYNELADYASVRSPLSGIISFIFFISNNNLSFNNKYKLLKRLVKKDIYQNALINRKEVINTFSFDQKLCLFLIDKKMYFFVLMGASFIIK